jgi:hypothetical protein
MSKSTKSIDARNLREYFNADPKRLAALDKEDPTGRARKSVEAVNGKFPRGQVSPVAIAVNNKRRPTAQYVRGNSGTLAAQAKADAQAIREKAKAQGLTVGLRGPLPNEVRKALGMKVTKRSSAKVTKG